jgi:methylthioribose-1-phosphate isomerase
MALVALKIESAAKNEFLEKLRGVSYAVASTRPTTRNLL